MIASHELNFGSRIIFKRLYVVSCFVQVNDLWNFFVFLVGFFSDRNGHGHCCVLSVCSRLSSSLLIDRFAWLLSQSLLAHIAADDCGARIFAFSLNKHDASPESRNRNAIHAFIESLIRPFVIDSYYSKILKSCNALVMVHLEIGILYDK